MITAATKYYTCAETAKFVREALKKAFPGQKFSVRSNSYSGGASITISWTDGVTEGEVKAIVEKFEGASFDGMQDLKTDVYTTDENGNRIHYGADFIFTRREYTKETIEKIAAMVAKFYNIEVPEMNKYDWYDGNIRAGGASFTDRMHEALNCYSVSAQRFIGGRHGYLPGWLEDLQEAQNGESKEMTAVLGQKPDPTAWYAKALQKNAAAAAKSKVIQLDAPATPPPTFPSGSKTTARRDSFKGHPVIIISLPDGQEFSFGVKKARAILDQIEALKALVEDFEEA